MHEVRRTRGSCLLKALGALAVASATATSSGSSMPTGASCGTSRAALTPAAIATSSRSNRWVSRALATRGGAEEPDASAGGEDGEGGISGVLSEVQIALSSFVDLVGEKLVVVDNAKKGTTKEVRARERERSDRARPIAAAGSCLWSVCGWLSYVLFLKILG